MFYGTLVYSSQDIDYVSSFIAGWDFFFYGNKMERKEKKR